jgi:hypothetical protein
MTGLRREAARRGEDLDSFPDGQCLLRPGAPGVTGGLCPSPEVRRCSDPNMSSSSGGGRSSRHLTLTAGEVASVVAVPVEVDCSEAVNVSVPVAGGALAPGPEPALDP